SGDTQLTLHAQLEMLLASAAHNPKALAGFSGLGTDVTESADGARLVSAYADALAAVGKFDDAEAQYRRAQAIRERVLPPDHIDRALGMQKIAGILAVRRRSAEALAAFEASQPAIERAFPLLRREAIEGLRFRAMAEADLGHRDRALELHREIVARR